MGLRGTVKHLTQRALADALYYTGALGVYRRRVMRSSAVVLVYHRIVDEPPDLLDYSPSGMCVRRDAFDAQMAYLSRHYTAIPLSELAQRVSDQRTLDDRLCAVTFDDGWRDNYTHAFPILKKHNVPATIFLATNFVDGGSWFWEERLKYVLAHVMQRHLDRAIAASELSAVSEVLARLELSAILAMGLPRFRQFLSAHVTTLRAKPEAERARVMDALEGLIKLESLREPRRFMNWDEIREMEAAGMHFGAHTVSHVNLERSEQAAAEREIAGSKSRTEASLANAAPVFAYPFGRSTPAVRAFVQKVGFRGAFTIVPGLVRRGADPMQLNRIDINQRVSVDLPFFACRALNFMEMY
ncbi:MAG TPA: polysaccharide deacetylase family protein [Vicinamibacterales bacterium]|jgi:peptidoglycan/xylan/chitin deacetylase (PgdA/CDA1 family)